MSPVTGITFASRSAVYAKLQQRAVKLMTREILRYEKLSFIGRRCEEREKHASMEFNQKTFTDSSKAVIMDIREVPERHSHIVLFSRTVNNLMQADRLNNFLRLFTAV
jgi:hypothetical protein